MGHYAKRFFCNGIVKDGLKLWYDMGNSNCYPLSGTSVFDLSESGYNGLLSNSAVYSAVGGGSVYFNNTRFVAYDSSLNYERTQAFSFGIWVYSNTINNSTSPIIVDNITSAVNRGYGLFDNKKYVPRNKYASTGVEVRYPINNTTPKEKVSWVHVNPTFLYICA